LLGNQSGAVEGAGEDTKRWFGTVEDRREQYATPHIVRSLIATLRFAGILPAPRGTDDPGHDWHTTWPDLHQRSADEVASTEKKRAQVVKTLATSVPQLRGDAAIEYVETGELPDLDANALEEALDEADEEVVETFHTVSSNSHDKNQPHAADGEFVSTTVSGVRDIPLTESDEPGDLDRMWGHSLGQDTRYRAGLSKDGGDPTQFLVKLERKTGEGWVDIMRSDHNPTAPDGHDVTEEGVHIDYGYGDRQSESITGPAKVGDGFRRAEKHITENAQKEIERYKQWKTQKQETNRPSKNSAAKRSDGEWRRSTNAPSSISKATNSQSSNANRYQQGDIVSTPDGIGVVTEALTERFESDENDISIEASPDSPTYMVVLEDEDEQVGFYKASDLEADEIGTDVDPMEGLAANANDHGRIVSILLGTLTGNDWSPPPSWRKSETPARLIALQAFAGMEGSFDGCVREMRGNVATPERFCGGFLDYVLGNKYWRGDSPLPGD
jgi:hypothetical protein